MRRLRIHYARQAMSTTVDFGAERVSPGEKTRRVARVFDAVSHRYDLMNDIMSLGSHRLMKRAAVEMARLRPGKRVLDLAGGTGDVAALAARQVGEAGEVVLADINGAMLNAGRTRLLNKGLAGVRLVHADAAALPFEANGFDAVLVAFGVRNFTDKAGGLREMARVLRPGGVAVVLEFAKVEQPLLSCAYDVFKSAWPLLGKAVVGDAAPYRYLVESIAEHPGQRAFCEMMTAAGFREVEYDDLIGGAAAIHRGRK